MKQTVLAFVLAAVFAASAYAAPQELNINGFAEARKLFNAAVGGDAEARDKAIAAFQSMAAANPGHPSLAAYEGAATAMKGRDAFMPWDKLKYAEKGADTIEKALAQLTPAHDEMLINGSPESQLVRLVAVNTLLALPDFMNRKAGGKRALEQGLASPAFAQSNANVKAGFLSAAARIAGAEKRQADEINYLKQVVALVPQAPDGAKAAARLKELGQ
jgi:hypothetical protein